MKKRMIVVTNTGGRLIHRAGKAFPPNQTIVMAVMKHQYDEIRAVKALDVADHNPLPADENVDVDDLPADDEESGNEKEDETVLETTSLEEMTAKEIINAVVEGALDRMHVIEAEREGKGRKTVIEALERMGDDGVTDE